MIIGGEFLKPLIEIILTSDLSSYSFVLGEFFNLTYGSPINHVSDIL